MGEVGAADMIYTQDGTVDFKGNPALKKSTGNWRACPYILGTHIHTTPFFVLFLLVFVASRCLIGCMQRASAASGWPTTA